MKIAGGKPTSELERTNLFDANLKAATEMTLLLERMRACGLKSIVK